MTERASDLADWVVVLPWFIPSVAVAVAIAVVASDRLARALDIRRLVAGLMIVCVGAVVGATLMPLGGEGEAAAAGWCDFSKLWPDVGQLRRLNDETLNVLLFVPLGATVAFIRPARVLVVVLGAALMLPVLIESIQAAAPALHRGCESGDVIDNLIGLLAGIAVGLSARAVALRLGRAT